MEITREEFLAYENVRVEGLFNMFSSEAIALSGLSKDKYLNILTNYSTLYKKYMRNE